MAPWSKSKSPASPEPAHRNANTPDSSVASDNHTDTEKPESEKNKLWEFFKIMKTYAGVSDLAKVRFSLPASLLEPIPNLEYWNYLDCPDTFTSIGDSDDALDRMLEVLRFWCTKDLKFIKNRPYKAYNSTLGEFFRCNWEVDEAPPAIVELRKDVGPVSVNSRETSKDARGSISSIASREPTHKLTKPVKVSFLTEQTSHHPPVSAFYAECPSKGISARGFDQIAAKFEFSSVKVSPGEHNLGIYITLHKRDEEEYHLTHPSAHVSFAKIITGGGLKLSVGDTAYIRCSKTRMKAIMHYKPDGWVYGPRDQVDGAIFKYDPENDDKTEVKHVPAEDILAKVSGNWKEKIFLSFAPDFKTQMCLVDLTPLSCAQKIAPPLEAQLSNESRKHWEGVTEAIKTKQFSKATKLKLEIEERQREKLRERERAGIEWTPRFFTGAVTPLGRPELTSDGVTALKKLEEGDYKLEENRVFGA